VSDKALRWAWSQRALAPSSRIILMVLGDHADGEGCAIRSLLQIADEANVSIRTLYRAIRSLEDCDPPMILRERREIENRRAADKRAMRLPTRYRLYLLNDLMRPLPDPEAGAGELAPAPELDPRPSPDELFADPGRPAGLELSIEEGWARLVALTPNALRAREHEARQQFERAADDGTDPRVIVGAWQEHARIWVEERADPKYIPFLVNWLKGRRWDDSLEAVRKVARDSSSPAVETAPGDAEKFRGLVKEHR
jgi:hypothetical protein